MKIPTFLSGSLYGRLLASHLQIAGIAAFLLCICLTMIAYFQHQAAMIADVRFPTALASVDVNIGIDSSNSELRSWILLRNEQHLRTRQRAWDEQIDPGMSKLESLAAGTELTTIASLRDKMALLRVSQWWIEDVAAATGNNPALLIYERDLLPNFAQIQSAVTGLEIIGANSQNISHLQIATAMTHQSLSEVIRQLNDAVRTGGIAELKEFRDGSHAVRRMLAKLTRQIESDSDAARLLNWISREYRTYEELANQTILIRQSDDWNRALYILKSETEPIAHDIKQVLGIMQSGHNALLQEDISRSALISRVGTIVTSGMIIGLALIAWALARNNSARLVAPIEALAAASDKLAESEDRPVQLPIEGPREIAHLTRRFNFMGRELASRSKELRHANKELQAYTHIITHDLKPPLINIKGHAGLIKTKLQELEHAAKNQRLTEETIRNLILSTVSSDIPESVNYIDLSISKMKTLVDGVFDNSKLLFRSVSLEDVDMNELVMQTTALFSHRSENVDIRCNQFPVMRTDVFLMEHIFSNLIDNALKYLDPDRPGRIELGGRLLGDEAHFYVRDNGIGLTAAAGDIFELFRQADSSNAGKGVGLALVETMLARLGGRIWYERNDAHGTTFLFCVPADLDQTEKII